MPLMTAGYKKEYLIPASAFILFFYFSHQLQLRFSELPLRRFVLFFFQEFVLLRRLSAHRSVTVSMGV